MASGSTESGTATDARHYRVLLDELGAVSPRLASAFMETAPAVAHRVGHRELASWAAMGQDLALGGWANLGLAVRFFERTPRLLDLLPVEGLALLATSATALSSREPEVAQSLVRTADLVLDSLRPDDRMPYLELLRAIVQRCWSDADRCIENTPAALASLTEEARGPLLQLARACVEEQGAGSFDLFGEASDALAALPAAEQSALLEEAARTGSEHPSITLEMLRSAPEVLERLTPEAARAWWDAGWELLEGPAGADRARAWLRLESTQARDLLAELAGRVEMSTVVHLLRLYVQALCGREVVLQPLSALLERGIGWSSAGRATSDGTSLYLPPLIDLFEDHESNFAAYKVHATLQATRVTHGSFDFELGVDGAHLPATVHLRHCDDDGRDDRRPAIRRLQRRFAQPRLFAWLFSLVEGTRIDAVADLEYPGIRPDLRKLRDRTADDRAPRTPATPRAELAEDLVLASLGHAERASAPLPTPAAEALAVVRLPGATVQDSAEAAALLYDVMVELPNTTDPGRGVAPGGGPGQADPLGELPDQPEMHGEYRPDTVQMLEMLEDADPEDRPVLDSEELVDLLRESTELDGAGVPFDDADFEDLAENLLEHVAARVDEDALGPEDEIGADESDDVAGEPSGAEVSWFHYDEWDFRAQDYRSHHCRLGERRAPQGALEEYEKTLKQHHRLVVQTRRRFEQLRPEAFRKINRLEDGSEIDFDEAIAFHADKLAGTGPLPRFYTRRNKIVRDVAVALLVDLSASTREPAAGGDRRVIDVVRDSTVLMIEALEATGDTYGIFGFSGQGRHDVEVHVVKELDEPLDDAARTRVAGMEPMGATRMGAAIRHVVARLNDVAAKVKLLILVSDGRPEDEDYGPERGGIEYPLHDTKRALVEAKQHRIEPFLITVDSRGEDYLSQMCDDLGYEVVSDVESLPRRLTRLYRYLTAE